MLKATNKKVVVTIEIPCIPMTLECRLLESSTFRQYLFLLQQLFPEIKPYYEINEQVIVIEKKNMQICDKNIPLSHLHVQNGMTFLLF